MNDANHRPTSRFAHLGQAWVRVGREISGRALELVDTGLQATADALDHDVPAGERGRDVARARIGRLGEAAGTWVDVGLEIGRVAIDATADGLRETAETLADEGAETTPEALPDGAHAAPGDETAPAAGADGTATDARG